MCCSLDSTGFTGFSFAATRPRGRPGTAVHGATSFEAGACSGSRSVSVGGPRYDGHAERRFTLVVRTVEPSCPIRAQTQWQATATIGRFMGPRTIGMGRREPRSDDRPDAGSGAFRRSRSFLGQDRERYTNLVFLPTECDAGDRKARTRRYRILSTIGHQG